MKVCYLANSRLPSRYANSVHVTHMAAGLSRAGAEVTLLALKGDSSLLSTPDEAAIYDYYGLERSFRIEWLPSAATRGRSFFAALATWRELKHLAPDLALGRHLKACVAACLREVPTVYETHKPLAWHSRVDRFLLKRMIASDHFRGLITISSPLRDILAEETGLAESRILVAHDAATVPRIGSPKSLGPAGRPQIGYVGAFFPGRGIELILDLADSLPEMDFHFIGGSRVDLAEWFGSVPERQNVHFHDFQPPSRAAAMRAGCDVLLAPYQRKTLIKDGWDTTKWMSPLKIFEYMAAAKPILCSDLPVLREVMVDGQNAILLPPDDPSAWAAALRRLASDPDAAAALGARAFADFSQNHTWEQRAKRILKFAGAGA